MKKWKTCSRTASSLLLLGFAVAASGCATTYDTMPDRPDFRGASDGALRGVSLFVDVRDQREEQTNSEEVTARVGGHLRAALAHDGATLLPSDAPPLPTVVVEVDYLRADFAHAQWKGCVRFNVAIVSARGATSHEVPRERVARCVTKVNVWGYGTASSALSEAYASAIAGVVKSVRERVSEPNRQRPEPPASAGPAIQL